MRWLNKRRRSGSCAVLAILNAAKWQRGGYTNQTQSGIHDTLCDALLVSGTGPTVGRMWRIIRILKKFGPRVYRPTFRKLNAILDSGSAAIVVARMPGDNCKHAVFVHRRYQHPRYKHLGIGYEVVGWSTEPKWVLAKRFRQMMKRDLAIFTVYGDVFEKDAA